MIDQQLAAFLHDGVGIHLGTRNQDLEPNGARAISVKVDARGTHLVVYMADVAARRVLPDLHANGHAAVVVARPTDERACQVKGTFAGARPIDAAERAHAQKQWSAFLDSLEFIGIPRSSTTPWISTPDIAIVLTVSSVFEQTPGADAGKRLV